MPVDDLNSLLVGTYVVKCEFVVYEEFINPKRSFYVRRGQIVMVVAFTSVEFSQIPCMTLLTSDGVIRYVLMTPARALNLLRKP